ncbi:PP2C family protein-serine/threonine phosphatase [Streptomyces fuscichromogenes]|uniref:PP2C family protein-serine/threonine phosphatase n=1 Tax=Streptomyces fuscichromogenes TaxID=1324013 RepID=UPI003826CCC3
MRQARDHGGDHWPLRPLRRPVPGLGMPVSRRAASQLAAGMPVVPVLIVSGIALVDVIAGSGMFWLPLLAAGPALAASTNGPRGVLCVGFLAAVLGASRGVEEAGLGRETAAVLSALLAVTLASALASALRGRRERVLAAVRSVAEAAQHAVLKPIPETVGPFRVAVRYSAAAAEARIGGDLYALVPTPHGIRLIVGDVRGKGLPAVEIAALVLGVFREAAYDEPDLLAVVGRIERSLARNLGPDDFVTAVVVGHPRPGQLEVVNCGHAPPLLIPASGGVIAVEATRPAPPLGLRALVDEPPCLEILPFCDGDQLLLYTDGVIEARDRAHEFYPLAERVARHLSDEPEDVLSAIHDELLTHVGGRLHDDAALLLLRMRTVGEGEPVPSAPRARETALPQSEGPEKPEGPDGREAVPVVSHNRSAAVGTEGGRRTDAAFSAGLGR